MMRIAIGALLSLLLFFAAPVFVQAPQDDVKQLAAAGYVYDADSFRAAVQSDDVHAVDLFLASGMNPNVGSNNETPPIIDAAEAGNRVIVEKLLGYGADPNIPDDSGKTALYYAVENDYPGVVQLLLKYGADPNVVGDDATTPLMLAARENQPETVRLLLVYGANIYAIDEDGDTALTYAANAGSDQAAAVLVQWLPRKPITTVGRPPETLVIVHPERTGPPPPPIR